MRLRLRSSPTCSTNTPLRHEDRQDRSSPPRTLIPGGRFSVSDGRPRGVQPRAPYLCCSIRRADLLPAATPPRGARLHRIPKRYGVLAEIELARIPRRLVLAWECGRGAVVPAKAIEQKPGRSRGAAAIVRGERHGSCPVRRPHPGAFDECQVWSSRFSLVDVRWLVVGTRVESSWTMGVFALPVPRVAWFSDLH